MKKIYYFLFIMFCATQLFAQDEIWTIDGRTIQIRSYSEDNEYYEIDFIKLNGKKGDISMDNAFCIKTATGETMLYKKDSMQEMPLSDADMRLFVNGAQIAERNYKANFYLITGALIGIGGFVGMELANQNVILRPIVPALFVTTVNFIPVCKKLPQKFGIEESDIYRTQGFISVAEKKKFRQSLYGAGIGIVLGVLSMGYMQ